MADWTVQELIDEKMTVRASCPDNHTRELNLEA